MTTGASPLPIADVAKPVPDIAGIDHLLVGVRDLESAARQWRRLGFQLTPRGRHIGWGTANYCIMFQDDYLELLGIVDPAQFTNNLDRFLATREGRYVDVNPAGCRMLGMTRDEVLSGTFTDVLDSDEHQRLPAVMSSLADGAVHRSEWRFRRKDGSVFVGELAGHLERLDEGQPFAVWLDRSPSGPELIAAVIEARSLTPGRLIGVLAASPEGGRSPSVRLAPVVPA